MSFDPYNCFLKIQKSIRIPTSKMRAHLGMRGLIPSHLPTLPGTWNVTLELHFEPKSSQVLALVASRRLRSWHLHYDSTMH